MVRTGDAVTPLRPFARGVLVRLSPFWGAYAGPQDARVVRVVGDLVTVDPPLDGVTQWQRRELRRSHMAARSRGFGTLPAEQRTELARKGGLAAHRSGHAHEWTSEQARVAGRKGGKSKKNKSRRKLVDPAP